MTCWNGFDMVFRARFVKMTEYSSSSPKSSFGTARYSSLEGSGGWSREEADERKRPERQRATGDADAARGTAWRAVAAAAPLPVFRAMFLIARCDAAHITEDMASFAPVHAPGDSWVLWLRGCGPAEDEEGKRI